MTASSGCRAGGGVVHLIPETIERNRVPPRVVIDRVRVGGTWQLNVGDRVLELDADQRDVAFGFTVLSFQDPSSVGLEYRLLGYSDEWLGVEDCLTAPGVLHQSSGRHVRVPGARQQ